MKRILKSLHFPFLGKIGSVKGFVILKVQKFTYNGSTITYTDHRKCTLIPTERSRVCSHQILIENRYRD